MDTLLEQATPQAIITDELCRSSFGKFTEQDMARIARRIARRLSLEAEAVTAYEPLVKALREIAAKMDAWEAECRQAGVWLATDPDARMAAWVRDAARAALATVESSPAEAAPGGAAAEGWRKLHHGITSLATVTESNQGTSSPEKERGK